MKNSFIKNFILTSAGNFLVVVLGLANSVLITRWLGPENKGVYTLVANIVIFLNLLFGEGLRRSNTIIIAKNNKYLKKIIINNLLFLLIIISINIILLLCSNFIIHLIENMDFQLLFITLLISTFSIMWQATQAIYLGLKKFYHFNILMVIVTFIILFSNSLGILLFNFGVKSILLSMFFANFIVFIWGITDLYKRANLQTDNLKYKLGSQFILSLKSTTTQVEVFVFMRSGIFILNNLVSSAAVGVFSVAFMFSDLIQRLPNIAGTLVFSKVANKESSLETQTAKVVRTVIFIITVLVIIVIIAGKIIILTLYGGRYLGAYKPLVAMSLGLILFGAGSVLHSYYMGKSFPHKMIYLNTFLSLFAIITNYYFISNFSILGAGYGYSIIMFIWGFAYIVLFLKETDISVNGLLIIKKSDIHEIFYSYFNRRSEKTDTHGTNNEK